MNDSHSDVGRKDATEELILRTIAAQADSLLRTARRHSICTDDAQDAYQCSIEIFMAHAHRLDDARAPGWLHVVVRREAQSIRRSRQKSVASTDVDPDGQAAHGLRSPEERVLSFDVVSRSAEALKRLKPQELRALWLRAEGHSYSEIAAITGWSYTKVNRCLTEGRRGFLDRYESIESGAECDRWQATLSAIVDGEATAEQLQDVRPHLRNCSGCRATLKSLRDSSTPLAALLPVPLLAGEAGSSDHLPHLLMRLYEGFAGGLHERAVHSFTKTQALVEASAAGKVAAVASSAAAVAGGGYASVERVIDRPATAEATVQTGRAPSPPPKQTAAAPTVTTPARKPSPAPASPPKQSNNVFAAEPAASRRTTAPEFSARGDSSQAPTARFASAAATSGSTAPDQTVSAAKSPPPSSAPEFSSAPAAGEAAPEFGP